MELFDTDRSGEVDFEEFLNGLSVFSSRGNKRSKLKCIENGTVEFIVISEFGSCV
jgi:hypothetical protein